MAYKFNKGTFNVSTADSSGDSLQVAGAIQANSDSNADVKGGDIDIAGNLTGGGFIEAKDVVVVNGDNNLGDDHVLILSEDDQVSANKLFKAGWSQAGSRAEIQFFRDDALRMELQGSVDSGADAGLVLNNSSGAARVTVAGDKLTTTGASAHVTTTGNLTITGQNDNEPTLTVTGQLDVNGTTVDLNTENVFVKNNQIQLDSGAANQTESLQTIIRIGPADANGALIGFNEDGSANKMLTIQKANATGDNNYMNLIVEQLIGDGSLLSNVPNVIPANQYSSNITFLGDANGNLQTGINVIKVDSGGLTANRTYTLPAVNTLTEGDVFRIVNLVTNAGETRKSIIAAPSGATIDGVASIELASVEASVDIVYYDNGGSGKFCVL